MDPITQRILDQQRAISQDPNFSGYKPSNTNGIAAINTAPVNQDLLFENTFSPQETPPIDLGGLAKNVGKKMITDYAVKKLGIDGIKANVLKSVVGGNNLMGLSNPITAAFTVGSLLPDSVKGIAGVLRNNRAQKAIERDIIRDMQGKITTSNPRTTNMQSTGDRNRGDRPGGGNYTAPASTPSSSPRSERHSGGAGGLHSGY
jgi:hypothetical protein|tara:strand:- start:99 stop:707 length:609 start_codon:yes stop_codon:yes gene_type:complete